MTLLDDAIASQLAHPAGALGDPLSDSIAEQQACTGQPPLREGWEHEPIEVPHHWRLYALALCIGIFGSWLSGCSHAPQHREPSAKVRASCPPLTPAPERQDADARDLRAAEIEGWYRTCRDAVLEEPAAKDPAGFTGWQ